MHKCKGSKYIQVCGYFQGQRHHGPRKLNASLQVHIAAPFSKPPGSSTAAESLPLVYIKPLTFSL